MKAHTVIASLSAWVGVSVALQACPLDAQSYPPPTGLASEAAFKAAAQNVTNVLNTKYAKRPYSGFSYSVSVFSASGEGLDYQYHHTSPSVRNSTRGTRNIDANSVYRIGSISKLLTVYILLANAGDRPFADSITTYLPQLDTYASQTDELTPDWDSITLGDLAGQMAGLVRDFGLADFAIPKNSLVALPPSIQKAFPNVSQSEVPPCGYLLASGVFVDCNEDEYIKGVATESPIFSTAYTPVYSNEAFALIGFAIEKMTGSSMEALFNKTIVDALNLNGTSYTVPATVSSNDILPGPETWSNWASELGVFNPVGGYFSSTNDMATFGKSILNNKVLTKAVTDRWFKPSGFIENHNQAVGRPWEIFRLTVNGQSVEVFVKGGDWGDYHTFFALVPQYNVGFSVFSAQDPNVSGSVLEGGIPNQLLDVFLPAIDDIAKAQAAANLAGHYVSASGNSSATVSTDPDTSGILLTEWVSQGVDLLGFFNTSLVPDVVWRLQPNQLYSGNKLGVTSYYGSPEAPTSDWYWPCPGWVDVDEVTYGNIALGNMVFDLGSDGKATALEVRSLRETLTRQS